jgi:hypothetical protein
VLVLSFAKSQVLKKSLPSVDAPIKAQLGPLGVCTWVLCHLGPFRVAKNNIH